MRDETIEKIKKIQFLLAAGKTRPEVAKTIGYGHVTGLYHFAARHKLIWNDKTKNYDAEGNGEIIDGAPKSEELPTGRTAGIIAMFKIRAIPSEIIKRYRFDSVSQMAEYMKSKGYTWDDDIENYVLRNAEASQREQKSEITDLLAFLNDNKQRLIGLLKQTEMPSETLPRYIIPGVAKVKSINLSSSVDSLVQEYSREYNISQKEIFHIALVEFFKKYGYINDVRATLKI